MTHLLLWLTEAARNVGHVLLWIGLFLLALLLLVLLPLVAIPWKLYVTATKENRKAREILSGTGAFYKALALAIDQLGNVAFGGLFNDLLVQDPALFPFGKTHETISEVLGWNEYLDNLTKSGRYLVDAVNLCDFTQKEHCAQAMASGFYEAKYKVEFYKRHIVKAETIERTKELISILN